MTIATIEMSVDELDQLRADLASARTEVRRLRAGAPPNTEVEQLRRERDHLAGQNGYLRDAANELHRAEVENGRLQRAVTAIAAERDTARAELKDALNRIAGIRETNRRLSAKWQGYAEQARQRQIRADNLQRQLDDANAALIAASEDRLMARALSRALDSARRPNPPTTEEQP